MSELRSQHLDSLRAAEDICQVCNGLKSRDPKEGFLSGCRCPKGPPAPLPQAVLVKPKPQPWILGDDDPEWQTFLRFCKRVWRRWRN